MLDDESSQGPSPKKDEARKTEMMNFPTYSVAIQVGANLLLKL